MAAPPIPPLNFTGGAAGPSNAGGANYTNGGLTINKSGPWPWLALAAVVLGLLWYLKR